MQQLLHNVQPTSINDIVDQEIFLHFPFDIAERRTPALLFKKKKHWKMLISLKSFASEIS